ncbi:MULTISPECIES: CoA-acylating methylmalonate-semialdehyde dehydrogenase [Photobacterium]|uniref:methylmalonate-semialdehyde dehydrogenase (CoA acylating) n=1 Tax=Photobacterium halotolerans TaxID=265726 RepID=A0A0F5V9B8_9GAMM|nr:MULTISPECIES: CoA-acylating methylmalonate-semialdehyde dehydrogenase [Photobacterium]KKC98723.1 methylmalonate-semialdehyde dehydrogenase [Photobacterium halotolerans]UIP30760.1 CoA-acylating methylmalonate-semialdehyde dehydrogenase [Photobacterium sp. TLY01]
MIGNYINSEFVPVTSGRNLPVTDPATGKVIDQVGLSSVADTEQAIASAEAAWPAWAQMTPLNRSRILFRFKALLEQNMDELATLISREHGKVHSDALGELTRGLEVVEFACGIPHLQKGEHSRNVGTDVDSHSMLMPLGVCAGITPFNFPVMVPMWMFPIALATGNTFVLKPSEKNPSAALRLAELLSQAGLPPGVFNVVQGDKESVDVLLSDPRVKAVSFVGSTPIAEYIYSQGSAHGKRVQALGGAKNHLVVMPDADLDQAVNALMGAAFGAAGERCMAISVAVAIGDEVADKLAEKLTARIRELRVGPGYGQSVENEMGPLITDDHMKRVSSYIDAGEAEGATLLVDGRDYQVPGFENGYYVGGTLFDHVTPEMTIYREEIFGPVLSLLRARSLDEALTLINEHEFGNGTAIFTADGEAARRFSDQVEVGMVGVNVPIPVPMAFHSFGGWKRSLFGPLHMHGSDGVRFFTRMKTITTRWPKNQQQQADFVMPTMK